MTVQYEGGDVYSISLGHKNITLSYEEIEKIQTYDFKTGKTFDTIEKELENDIDELNETIEELENRVEELENE